MTHSTRAVEDVLDKTEELLDGEKDYLHVSELIEELGMKSIAAVLVAPSLAVVSPLSGVPLFSSACGLIIALVSGQMLMGRENLWLPDFLSRRAVSANAAHKATQALRRVASWMDSLFMKRFQPLLSPPFVRVIQVICMLCGLAMPFLEILPFTSSILGAVVALLAVSMLTGDGLIALSTVTFLCLGLGGVVFHFW